MVVQPQTCSEPDRLNLPSAPPNPPPVPDIPPVTVTLIYTCAAPDTLSLAVTDVTTHVYQAFEWGISKTSASQRIDVRPATTLAGAGAADSYGQQVPYSIAVTKTGKAQAYALAGKVVATAAAANTGTLTVSNVQVTYTGNQQVTQTIVATCPSGTGGLAAGDVLTCTFNFTAYAMNAGTAGTVTATASVQPPLVSGATVIAPNVPYQFNTGQDQQTLEGDCADVTDQLTTDLRWLAPYWRVDWGTSGSAAGDTLSLPARVCRSTTFSYQVVVTPFPEELCSNVASFGSVGGAGWGGGGYYGTHRRELMLMAPQAAPVSLAPSRDVTRAPGGASMHPGTEDSSSSSSAAASSASAGAAGAAAMHEAVELSGQGGSSLRRLLGRKVLQDIATGSSTYYNPSSIYGTTAAAVHLFGVSGLGDRWGESGEI
jgi:hypothetical protein